MHLVGARSGACGRALSRYFWLRDLPLPQKACENREANLARAYGLKARFVEGLHDAAPDAIVNSRDDGSPYIVNVSLPSLFSQDLLDFLGERGIFISKASACTENHTTVPTGTHGVQKHPLSLQAAGIP